MSETHCVPIVSGRNGRGYVCFFDEPFGEQTPFELAGGFSVQFDSGVVEGGPITSQESAQGLNAWLARNGWRLLEEVEALIHT